MQPPKSRWLFLFFGLTENYYYFCRNNTNINMAENKKAKRHNYQGGEKSSYIEIFK